MTRMIAAAAVRADSALDRYVKTREDALLARLEAIEERIIGVLLSKVSVALVLIGFLHLALS